MEAQAGVDTGIAPQVDTGLTGGSEFHTDVNFDEKSLEINDKNDTIDLSEGGSVNDLNGEGFFSHLNESFDLSDADTERIKDMQEKYGFDNETITKMIEMEADKSTANRETLEAAVSEELSQLSESEKSEVQKVYDYYESILSEKEMDVFHKNYTTAKYFREAKEKMNFNSEELPNVEGGAVVFKEFTSDDYSEVINNINSAESRFDFDKAEDMKKDLKRTILARGSSKLKKDLEGFLRS